MFKVLRFRSGPYEEAGYVWCVAEIEDDTGDTYEEEIFYDSIEEAFMDLEEYESLGFIIDNEEDYLTEAEEQEIDSW